MSFIGFSGFVGLVPIGACLPWLKSYTNTPTLATQGRAEYVEMNGQTLSDANSGYNGQVIPNVNNSGGGTLNRFLRGNTTSGGTGGAATVSGTTGSVGLTACVTGTACVSSPGACQVVTSISLTPSTHTHSFSANTPVDPYYDVVYIFRVK